jgi:hypothetical protein
MRQAYNELSKRMMVDGGRIIPVLAKNLKNRYKTVLGNISKIFNEMSADRGHRPITKS